MSEPKFPKQIFVTIDPNGDEGSTDDLLAKRDLNDAVEEHGRTHVAKYELKEVKQFEKALREVK